MIPTVSYLVFSNNSAFDFRSIFFLSWLEVFSLCLSKLSILSRSLSNLRLSFYSFSFYAFILTKTSLFLWAWVLMLSLSTGLLVANGFSGSASLLLSELSLSSEFSLLPDSFPLLAPDSDRSASCSMNYSGLTFFNSLRFFSTISSSFLAASLSNLAWSFIAGL